MWNQLPSKENLECQSKHLKMLRHEHKWKKSDVYNAIETTAKTYDSWENGEKQPTTSLLINLSDLYSVSTDFILGRTEDRNIGNCEISALTGLSEKSIEVLRFLNSPLSDKEDETSNKRIILLLNMVLESSYPAVIQYRKDEQALTSIIEARSDDEMPGDPSNDPCPIPVQNVFSTMYQFVNPEGSTLSFLDGDERITVSGAAATVDSNGDPTIFTINELKRITLFDRIKKQLTALAEEEKNNG